MRKIAGMIAEKMWTRSMLVVRSINSGRPVDVSKVSGTARRAISKPSRTGRYESPENRTMDMTAA